jgi:hypothetical protein
MIHPTAKDRRRFRDNTIPKKWITFSLVTFLARHLRKADVEEIRAFAGFPPGEPEEEHLERALCSAILDSETAVLCLSPTTGIPIALYGVGTFPRFPGIGFVWMHGTPALAGESRREFLRLGRVGLEELTERYGLLVCFADIRNTLHTRWLRWMGFCPLAVHSFHDASVPFLEFVLPGNPRRLAVATTTTTATDKKECA